jgi:hypothetical protein
MEECKQQWQVPVKLYHMQVVYGIQVQVQVQVQGS